MKKALITGITGQDGALLAQLLLEKDYKVYGTYRRLSTPNFWRLANLSIFDQIELISADLTDSASIFQVISQVRPDEIYNLAAQSFVETSFDQPIFTANITGIGVTRILESIRLIDESIKLYQASSSEQFGNGEMKKYDESQPFSPQSPYAAAKVYACQMTQIYREAYGLFTCNGILFNHESPLRGLEFVTRKVTNAVARIYHGLQNELVLGNLSSMRDWGYAPEYVEAMWKMLQSEYPGDYVIATGESHSVKDLVNEAFKVVGLDWQEYTTTNEKFIRPLELNYLLGDYSKSKQVLGWEPKVKFNQLVKIMVEADVDRWERVKKGERFPWDASNYF